MKTIIKRDGREVKFDKVKIEKAAQAAFDDVYGQGYETSIPEDIAYRISKTEEEKMSVEEIQDIVEKELMHVGESEVAKRYILYRADRTKVRNRKSDIIKKVLKRASASNVENMNANVDERSFSGREKECGGDVQKVLALDYALSPDVAEAHKQMWVYQHDLDKAYLGPHNCLNIDFAVLSNGFHTRNGDVRGAKSISTACQLLAVVFQCQSQVQFGGVGSVHVDTDLAPFVAMSFRRHVGNELYTSLSNESSNIVKAQQTKVIGGEFYISSFSDEFSNIVKTQRNKLDRATYQEWKKTKIKSLLSELEDEVGNVSLDNEDLKIKYSDIYDNAYDALYDEGMQAMQGLYHNLNTLESRQGSQVPFTSINLGRDTSTEGRLVTEWIMRASIDGIGKLHRTSIFPISIFQWKPGVNANPEDINYDLKRLALTSMSKRIYPNWVNSNWSGAHETENNPDTYFSTMGCVVGGEIVTYKHRGNLYVESFERFWDRMSDYHKTKHQYVEDNPNLYMDVDGVQIYDTVKGFVKVKRIVKNVSTDWVRVRLHNGRMLTCTPDHPFHTNRGRIQAKDLLTTDVITINTTQYNEETVEFNPDKAWCMGLILCDGSYASTLVVSLAYESENDIEAEYINRMRNVFNVEIETSIKERGKKGYYKDLIARGNGVYKIKDYLYTQFEGGAKSHRHIPNEVFSWNKQAKLAFLAGMVDADGYINPTTHGGSVIQIGSTNQELALQQMALAQSLGMPTKMYPNHYSSEHPEKIRYRVEFVPCEELLEYIVSNKKKMNFVHRVNEVNNITTTTVKEVEKLFMVDISYDVETESDHFEVSGIYSHNCRTMIGYDRHGLGYTRVGRGNCVPCTMILPQLGIKYGICTGERTEPDLDGFWKGFEGLLQVCEEALLERYDIISKQSPKSAPFMYENGTIADADKCVDSVEPAMKHCTLAMGYIGVNELCTALFGKNFVHDEKILDFAESVVKRIHDYASEASERNDLNFSCYATPAENLCHTSAKALREQYGVIEGVTDRSYLTNSHHVPVWENISIFEKLEIENRFCSYPTGGCITYVELDSNFINNIDAIEKIIDYAFNKLDIPYLAFNFPIDSCLDCGYQGDIPVGCNCPACHSSKIERLRRVTGYLTTDYCNFNDGKIDEVKDRIKHSLVTDLEEL